MTTPKNIKTERKRGREEERKRRCLLSSFLPFLLSSFLLLTASAAENRTVRVDRKLGMMGTTLTVSVEAADRTAALAASEKAIQALEAAEARLSTWRDDTELARFNRTPVGEVFALSQKLSMELTDARRWWQETRGAFDPGIGALAAAWGLRQGGRTPSADMLTPPHIGPGLTALDLEGMTAVRRHPALRIEEGGFGKGAGLDDAVRALADTDALSAVIDLGGQVALAGDAEPVSLGLADPADRHRSVLTVTIDRGALATSGNSERGLIVDGRRYSHILDPRTGKPTPDFGTITVWAPDAMTADCLSTGLYVLGPDQALEWAMQHPDIEVLVLEATDNIVRARATAGWKDRIGIEDDRVKLVFE